MVSCINMENRIEPKGHGISLFSGGLDSSLAVLLLLKQNIKVTAITFMMPFGCDISDKSSCGRDPHSLAQKFGFDLKLMNLGDKFIEMVKNPKHGYGKNMNPCIDCRIMMLIEAKWFMEMVGADFVFTGEVLGQRPMSQYRPQLDLIAREAGLGGKLLRPLSARLLPPTEPELAGIVDREQLENISGRSRKRQMELAAQLGLDQYPAPAGGCLLTDITYSRRLRDMLTHAEEINYDSLALLRLGRYFRISPQAKLIVGRNEKENEQLQKRCRPEDILFEVENTGSPLCLLRGKATEEIIQLAASITARYCDLKQTDKVNVTYRKNGQEPLEIIVSPIKDVFLEKNRI